MTKKLSGLNRLHLQQSYDSLLKLKKAIVYKESEEEEDSNEPSSSEDFKQQVDTLLSLFGSKLGIPKSLTISSMTMEDWTRFDLKIKCTCFIALKPNFKERIAATTSIGENELWLSANLYRQLHLLESLLPRTDANTRAWIDAFFFRASAMLPPNKPMVFNMDRVVPAKTSPSNIFLQFPHSDVPNLKTYMQSGFFVMEAKLFNPTDHVPQALWQMYACGRRLQQKVVHGALTNGRDWIFLLVKLNDDYDGASYKQAGVMQLITTKSNDGWPDLIAAILSHWIENSFVDLGGDDWFEPLSR